MTEVDVTARTLADFSEWLDDNWDPELSLREWWQRSWEGHWAVPTWPAEWGGRDLPRATAAALRALLTERQIPDAPAGIGMMMAGPTILAHGTDEQKRRWIPDIVTGLSNWCQLFSEPGAGSDLASVSTRAVRDGDRWIVTGQKVWTSNAHLADMGMLLARTDPDAGKREGLTYFAIDMDQPGAIEIRPLREMTGRSLFNEVFLNDAVVLHDDVIGGIGNGWAVARTTLASERSGLAGGSVGASAGSRAGALDLPAGDAAIRRRTRRVSTGTSMAMRGRVLDALRLAATESGATADPVVRQRLAQLHILESLSRTLQVTAPARGRRSADASIGKLHHTRVVRAARALVADVLGPAALLTGDDAPFDGALAELVLFSPAVSIYGGTDEVQRNILSERVLGLPRD